MTMNITNEIVLSIKNQRFYRYRQELMNVVVWIEQMSK